MPLFSERQTETGNVDYYSPGNELDNQIWPSSSNFKYFPSCNGIMTSNTILLTSIIAITAILGFSVINQQAYAATNYVISSPNGGDYVSWRFMGSSN